MQHQLFFVVVLSCITWTTDAGRSLSYARQAVPKLRGEFESKATSADPYTAADSSTDPYAMPYDQELGASWDMYYSASSLADWYNLLNELAAPTPTEPAMTTSGEPQPVLPDRLRPEVAYFDASRGVATFQDDSQIVSSWTDVFAKPDSPTDMLWLDGNCRRLEPSPNGVSPASIWFDGQSCSGRTDYGMFPFWDAGAGGALGAFTAIWIGRAYDSTNLPYPERASHTPFGFERDLYDYKCGCDTAAANGDAGAVDAGADGGTKPADGLVPLPPLHRWTMEVASRTAGESVMSYYRYGSGGADGAVQLGSWRTAVGPVKVFPMDKFVVGADLRDGLGYFYGELSVALLYNRPLNEGEVRELGLFYAERFGWTR